MKKSFACLMLFLMIFLIPIHHNYSEPTHEELKIRTTSLKPAGFWNNFTYILGRRYIQALIVNSLKI
ncbi:MAG: hypothetical protein ACFFCY_14830 [Promethearchaeota archaeon]